MQSAHRRRQPGAARADHRHPGGPGLRPRADRDQRFGAANADLTDIALRVGRLMALMFPTVMLVLNVSSVAVLWFGGHRVDDGADAGRRADRVPELPDADPDVGDDGDLHADDGAARRGVRRPDRRGARHRVVASCRRPTPVTELAGTATVELRGVAFTYPGADAAGAARHHASRARPGPDHRDHRLAPAPARPRWSTWSRGCSTPPAARCCVDGVDVRQLDPELLWSRIGLVPQRAYLFTGTVAQQPALRQARRHRRRAVGGARDRAGDATSSRRCPRGSTRRSPRAAPTSPAASGSGWRSPGRWSGSPEIYLFDDSFSALDLATDARLRAALRPVTARRDGGHRRAAGLDHRRRRPDRRARGRRGRRPRHPRRAARRPARPTPRSSSPSSTAEEAA